MRHTIDALYAESFALLQRLIETPSYSREEDKTAQLIFDFLKNKNIAVNRKGNNVWATNLYYDAAKPTVLLNSHHDTVKPNPAYTRDPFFPAVEDDKLYGLGSNDAGGALVSLLAAFAYFCERKNLNYNLIMTATAEEEISGFNGIESILKELPPYHCAIVGEPTLTDIATAEKGLMVIDCLSEGKAGHAAREEGVNAIYQALPDIEWFRTYKFPKVSAALGEIKMSVTVINAGQAHNQVPPECKFTVDIRATDAYALEELLEIIRRHVTCKIAPRSLRMRPSSLPEDNFLTAAIKASGKKCSGSPTTSDQALIPAASVKMGPGDSARSHSADEFIWCDEIRKGIESYINLLEILQH